MLQIAKMRRDQKIYEQGWWAGKWEGRDVRTVLRIA
jgi:hypothetical protein